MTQANPGQTLNNVSAAGAGTGIDFLGASAGVAVPTAISMMVTTTGWAASYDQSLIAAQPYATVGLEVSQDNASFVRISSCQVFGNGTVKVTSSFPCRYARAYIDTLDSRISAVTVNAWVAGGGTAASPYVPEPLTSGEALMLRSLATNGSTLLSTGNVQFSYWTAGKTETCTHVTTSTGGTASGSPSYSAVGVYSVAANGDLTRLAASSDLHASMWASTYTDYTASIGAGFAKVAGNRYALAALTVDASPCALLCATPGGLYFAQSPIMMAARAGQATLPASVTSAQLVAGPTFGMVLQGVVAP